MLDSCQNLVYTNYEEKSMLNIYNNSKTVNLSLHNSTKQSTNLFSDFLITRGCLTIKNYDFKSELNFGHNFIII